MLTRVELDEYHQLANFLDDLEPTWAHRTAVAIDALITEVINLQATIKRMKDQADHISWGHCDL